MLYVLDIKSGRSFGERQDKKGNLVLKGDLSQIKGGNAARLLQLVQSDKTADFWIGDKAPGLSSDTQPVGGGLSGTTGQGYNQIFSVVQADPSKVDSGDLRGVFLNADGSTTPGDIPGADIEETAAHDLLGHVWADLIGGQSAGTQGNKMEALIAEDRVEPCGFLRGPSSILTRENFARVCAPCSPEKDRRIDGRGQHPRKWARKSKFQPLLFTV